MKLLKVTLLLSVLSFSCEDDTPDITKNYKWAKPEWVRDYFENEDVQAINFNVKDAFLNNSELAPLLKLSSLLASSNKFESLKFQEFDLLDVEGSILQYTQGPYGLVNMEPEEFDIPTGIYNWNPVSLTFDLTESNDKLVFYFPYLESHNNWDISLSVSNDISEIMANNGLSITSSNERFSFQLDWRWSIQRNGKSRLTEIYLSIDNDNYDDFNFFLLNDPPDIVIELRTSSSDSNHSINYWEYDLGGRFGSGADETGYIGGIYSYTGSLTQYEENQLNAYVTYYDQWEREDLIAGVIIEENSKYVLKLKDDSIMEIDQAGQIMKVIRDFFTAE